MTADLLMIAGTWKGDGNWVKRDQQGQGGLSNEKPNSQCEKKKQLANKFKENMFKVGPKRSISRVLLTYPFRNSTVCLVTEKKRLNPPTVTPHSDKLTNIERVTEQTVTTPPVPRINIWDEGERIYSPAQGSRETQVVFLFKETISRNQISPAQTSAPLSLIFKSCHCHLFWKMQEKSKSSRNNFSEDAFFSPLD